MRIKIILTSKELGEAQRDLICYIKDSLVKGIESLENKPYDNIFKSIVEIEEEGWNKRHKDCR